MAIRYRAFTVTCPTCDHQFDTRAVLGAAPILSKSSDFHDHYGTGDSVLPHLVHFCDRCGFCGEEKYYAESLDKSYTMALRDFVEERLTPNLPWAREFLVDRYEHALKIAEFADETPMYLGDLALRGSWAAVEEKDTESERFFRRIAVQNYATALKHYDLVDAKQRANTTYLVGELWRRLGEESLAQMWFDEVEGLIVDPEQQWVLALAMRQKNTPREYM